MANITVEQFSRLSPAALRLAESEFVLQKFVESSKASHEDTSFLLTAYFDAFLFCYVSIEEMVNNPRAKNAIQSLPIFSFFKALRNVATHHCVLSGMEGKFPRPVTRIVKIGAAENAVFCVVPDKMEFVFHEILKIRPWERRTINSARAFLTSKVQAGGDILVAELMQSAINEVRVFVV